MHRLSIQPGQRPKEKKNTSGSLRQLGRKRRTIFSQLASDPAFLRDTRGVKRRNRPHTGRTAGWHSFCEAFFLFPSRFHVASFQSETVAGMTGDIALFCSQLCGAFWPIRCVIVSMSKPLFMVTLCENLFKFKGTAAQLELETT